MTSIAGFLNLNDTDRVRLNTYGQDVIYTAIQAHNEKVNADMNMAMSLFVSGDTDKYTERYRLPGGGRLQRRGQLSQPAAMKVTGYWDVGYPLEDFATQITSDDVSMAYMTVQDLDRHLSQVSTMYANTVRHEILYSVFNSTAGTFVDPINGSVTVQRLANGDSVLYPPVLGSEDEATENHYLESGYAASAISDTNDPYVTIAAELKEHFGQMTGGTNLIAFINPAQTAKTVDLTDVVSVADRYIQSGSDRDLPVNLPLGGLPKSARIIGRHEEAGVWIAEWAWIPANYIVSMDLDAEKPLKRRVDPADTRLGSGLQLVARDNRFPIDSSFWRARFGFGVANRLNGVVMELGIGGTYTVPSAYA